MATAILSMIEIRAIESKAVVTKFFFCEQLPGPRLKFVVISKFLSTYAQNRLKSVCNSSLVEVKVKAPIPVFNIFEDV